MITLSQLTGPMQDRSKYTGATQPCQHHKRSYRYCVQAHWVRDCYRHTWKNATNHSPDHLSSDFSELDLKWIFSVLRECGLLGGANLRFSSQRLLKYWPSAQCIKRSIAIKDHHIATPWELCHVVSHWKDSRKIVPVCDASPSLFLKTPSNMRPCL